jgi:hypothetical protein
MKIFKDWKENDISSFVIFLAKESQRQKKKMREYYKRFSNEGEVELAHIYHIQQGCAIQADMAYTMAKITFNLDKRKNVGI